MDHAKAGGTDVQIRAAKPSDAASILALEALFPSDRMSARSIRHLLASAGARVFVAVNDQALLGNIVVLLRAGSRRARIYSVVVSPHARGLRIGHRLVEAAEHAAKCNARDKVTLEVRADNIAAKSLYAGLGYIETHYLPAYYDDGCDGLRLERNLTSR